MPSRVAGVLKAAGLEPSGVVQWGATIPSANPGVYAVSLVADARATGPVLPEGPIRPGAVAQLLRVRPELRLDGARPTPRELTDRVRASWIPDEVILYLGLAGTSLAGRLGQYQRSPLGARSPHAGGWFLKLLSNLPDLFIHWVECADPGTAEDRMVTAFFRDVSPESATQLHDPANPLPFANLRWPKGHRKIHGITGATAGRSPNGPRTVAGYLPASAGATSPPKPRFQR